MVSTNPPDTTLCVEYLPIAKVIPDPKNARKHSAKQINKLAKIIAEFGWSSPMVVDECNRILAGHARHAAANSLGLKQVPCVRLGHLTAAQKKALAIADNAMTDASSWNDATLRETLIELTDLNFDVDLTGLEMGAIDFVIDGAAGASASDPADEVELPDRDKPTVSRLGDLWHLGKHRLLCGSALEEGAYEQLLGAEKATLIFSDPPFNVPVRGHVSGLGRHRHAEFAMASGELTEEQYRNFLANAMRQLSRVSVDGSMHFFCIDWRHVRTMLEAGDDVYAELKNLCVWVKTNGGMGSLYRSRHELIAVFKNGTAPHINNVSLGVNGRYRTNVWEYAGANTFSAAREQDLADHPTVKPIAMVADAIKDCSRRGDVVLDPFIGSGTAILAAERTGRRGFGIEIEPRYVDVAIRRFQEMTGQAVTLGGDGRTFADIADERRQHASVDVEANEEAGR